MILAGISARYALEKRSKGEFIRQRIEKLLVPFLSGLVLLVPFQTLYARKFFDGYTGGVWDNLCYFFTHLADFSGYDGAFTPGHLWFILFLFLISMIALVVWRVVPYGKAGEVQKTSAGFICDNYSCFSDGVLFTFLLWRFVGEFCRLDFHFGITDFWEEVF